MAVIVFVIVNILMFVIVDIIAQTFFERLLLDLSAFCLSVIAFFLHHRQAPHSIGTIKALG